MESCARHPDRPTGVKCTRCERPACPECLREASVGYQCVDCVREGQRTVRQPRTRTGAPVPGRSGRPSMVVTWTIIALNFVVFAINAVQAGSIAHNEDSPSWVELVLYPPFVDQGEWWRLFTSGFLHIGPIHILVNMISLWFVGRSLEPMYGRLRYTAIYLVSMLGGSAAVYILGAAPTAGASGAIFGLAGALLVTILKLRIPAGQFVAVIAINLFLTFRLSDISWQDHIGGLVVGALVAVGFLFPRPEIRQKAQVGTVVVVVLVLVGLMVGIGRLGVA
ncbi:rhomboid family intramembrane serine protease [Kibdelosporangium lantanae]